MQLKFSVTCFKWENPRVFCYLPETGPRVIMSGQPWNKKGPPSGILLPRLLGNNPKGMTLHAVSRVSAALLQKKSQKQHPKHLTCSGDLTALSSKTRETLWLLVVTVSLGWKVGRYSGKEMEEMKQKECGRSYSRSADGYPVSLLLLSKNLEATTTTNQVCTGCPLSIWQH